MFDLNIVWVEDLFNKKYWVLLLYREKKCKIILELYLKINLEKMNNFCFKAVQGFGYILKTSKD